MLLSGHGHDATGTTSRWDLGRGHPIRHVGGIGHYPHLGGNALYSTVPAMAKEAVLVRPWNRRKDRSAIERWPAVVVPHVQVLPGGRCSWAIDLNSELVGRITLRNEEEIDGIKVGRIGIYLHPARYGQGIGTAALRQFFTIAPVDMIWLDVAKDNHRAIRCYIKVGFKVVSDTGTSIDMYYTTNRGLNKFLEQGRKLSTDAPH